MTLRLDTPSSGRWVRQITLMDSGGSFKRRIKITAAIECRLLSHKTLATSLMAGVVIR